jgi:hypothetical protein
MAAAGSAQVLTSDPGRGEGGELVACSLPEEVARVEIVQLAVGKALVEVLGVDGGT